MCILNRKNNIHKKSRNKIPAFLFIDNFKISLIHHKANVWEVPLH